MQQMQVMSSLALLLALLAVARANDQQGAKEDGRPAFDLAHYESKLERLAKSNGEKELVEGVTVNKLLAMKQVDRKKCSRADLLPLWFTCEMLIPKKEARLCCLHYLDRAARFCARETLGQNPDQLDPIRRPLYKWAVMRKMDQNERTFWTSILNFAKGNPEIMARHLTYGLVPEGDDKKLEERYGHVIDSAELLSSEKLMDMLTRVRVMNLKMTLAILSRAKNKETTEVVKGVTVADLLKMNDASQRFCETPDEIIKRNKQCLATQELISVRFYCKSAVRAMASKCITGFGESNFDNWWLGVHEGLQTGLSGFLFRDDATELERYLQRDPATERAKFDYIMSDQFLEDRRKRAQERRDRENSREEEEEEQSDG